MHWLKTKNPRTGEVTERFLPMDPIAIAAPVTDVLDAWWEWLPWVDVTAPFAGALEEWPARLTQGLAIARREWHSIGVWQQWRHLKRK